ncbi:very-long-chain 3-oxoacyl-CoA reductase-like [Watersipora subatra]|uniref:very-long-chain 3-oxoacyl-CoA reductase-like n=1 Tax=Watersipora subatra TaxID=2589382 RepID=UPI00355AF343
MSLNVLLVECLQYIVDYRNWLAIFSTIILFVVFKKLVWTPFKLYVLAQCLPGVDLRKHGQWAVVTGATNGIGKSYARALAGRGLDIVLISRSDEKLEKVQAELVKDYSCSVKTVQADFARDDIYGRIRDELAGLDIGVLINNVGFSHNLCSILDFPDITISEELVRVNCLPAVKMSFMVLPGMAAKRKGVIVNVSSCLAYLHLKEVSLYSATKGYLYSLSNCMRVDCRNSGITIQTLTPGLTVTNLLNDLFTMAKDRKFAEMLAVTPDSLVSYALNTIGWADTCEGHPKHWFIYGLLSFFV